MLQYFPVVICKGALHVYRNSNIISICLPLLSDIATIGSGWLVYICTVYTHPFLTDRHQRLVAGCDPETPLLHQRFTIRFM